MRIDIKPVTPLAAGAVTTASTADAKSVGPAPDAFTIGGSDKVSAPSPQFDIDPTNPPTTPSGAAAFAANVGRWNKAGAPVVTASQVELQLREQWSNPIAREIARALDRDGPLGPVGPLGKYGPVGDQPWNPSYWTTKLSDWSGLSKQLADKRGPGSDDGPLGSNGPIAKQDEFPAELRAGGRMAALGPVGPLGALGPLGYTGQVGGHGLKKDADGAFVDAEGAVQRTVDVAGKKFELFEFYDKDYAQSLANNDTSWMVRAKAEGGGDEFGFSSNSDQVVTLMVSPENIKDAFQIEVLDAAGKVIAKSDSDNLVNWIQLPASAGDNLKVRVQQRPFTGKNTLLSSYVEAMVAPIVLSFGWLSNKPMNDKDTYRLFVVGSGPQAD